MGYLIRPYEFPIEPPTLASLLEHATERGGIPIRIEGSDATAIVAFIGQPIGKVGIQRKERQIWLNCGAAQGYVLVDLLDVCLRELGGNTKYELPRQPRLPLPLTEEYIAQEVRRLSRGILAFTLALLLGAVLVLATLISIAWFLYRLVGSLL